VKSRDDLVSIAQIVGGDWVEGPYYDEAEAGMDDQWRSMIWPLIEGSDFSCTVELAAGHGRNTEKLRHLAKKLYAVDINKENIEFMKARFASAANVVCVKNDGVNLDGIRDGEATFVYSFDAMVHFDSDVVRAYLAEFKRVLRPGGRGFCHYSNYSGNPTGSYREHPGWRNFMSKELFEHYAAKEGLVPLRSELVAWSDGSYTDAMTLFERPSG
jgi:ubiquinone/menaquinone biosynthesis C-methylase UbiE